jgi:hypothetical protein
MSTACAGATNLICLDSQGRFPAAVAVDAAPKQSLVWRLLRPQSPDPGSVFARIVRFWRFAFEAETKGSYKRADFYWNELTRAIEKRGPEDPCWVLGRDACLREKSGVSGAAFRASFLSGVVLESRIGLLRGAIAAGLDFAGRPKMHLEGIATAMASPADAAAIERAVDTIALEIAARDQGKGPDSLASFWLEMARLFPSATRFLGPALGELHRAFTATINSAAESQKLSAIDRAIDKTDSIRAQYPETHLCYRLLARLHHERVYAVAASSISSAFLSLAKAEVLAGESAPFAETRQQLMQALEGMRENAKRVKATVRQRSGAQLTAEGQRFIAEADAGTNPAETWRRSPKATRLSEERERAARAQNRTLNPVDGSALPLFPVAAAASPGQEDVWDWLGSPGGTRTRIQVLAAMLIGSVAIGATASTAIRDHSRNAAWVRVEAQRTSGSPDGLIQSLESYFSAGRTSPAMERDREAAGLYDAAIAGWLVTRSPGPLAAAERARLARYKQLVVDRGFSGTEVRQ